MKEQEEVLKWEAENDLIWVDEFEFDLEDIDKAMVWPCVKYYTVGSDW